MSIKYGFFNSVSGDRTYNAEDMSEYFDGLITNGVVDTIDDRMLVTAGSGMNVSVGTGRAIINCHWIRIKTNPVSVSIAASSVQYNRIDAVVLRYSAADRTISLAVKQGANFTSTPVTPTMTRTEEIYELCLAFVNVGKGVETISQSKIVDMRGRTDVCGFVTGLVQQVNTADLFTQYQAYCAEKTAEIDAYFANKQTAFNNWFSGLTSTFDLNTSITKYQRTATITAELSYIDVGIPQYEAGDVLLVHVDGVLFVEGSEFTISGTGLSARITLANTVRAGSNVTLICLKAVVGSNVVNSDVYVGNPIVESEG